MKTVCSGLVLAFCSLLMPGSVGAHHSRAAFDTTKEVTMTGVVTKFAWTNPHAYLFMNVADATGKNVEWQVEFGAIGGLMRNGYTRSTFKPGDKVKVVGFVALDPNSHQIIQRTVTGFTESGEEFKFPRPTAASPAR